MGRRASWHRPTESRRLLGSDRSGAAETRWLRPTSSTPFAPRSAAGRRRCRRSTRPTWARTRSTALVERTGIDPGAVEDVVFGCVDTIGGQAGDIARTCWLAAGLPDHVPGHHRRPPVRLVAAGGALRRAGGDVGHAATSSSPAACSRCRDPDLLGDDRWPSRSASPTRSPARRAGCERYGTQEVSQFRARRDDRREVGHHPRRHGGVRGRVARAGDRGPRPKGRFDARSRRSNGARPRRGPARAELGEDPLAADRWSRAAGVTAAVRQPDLRRVGRAAHRQRAGACATTA